MKLTKKIQFKNVCKGHLRNVFISPSQDKHKTVQKKEKIHKKIIQNKNQQIYETAILLSKNFQQV